MFEILEKIKNTRARERNIAQWFVLYAVTWGMLVLAVVMSIIFLAFGLYALTNGVFVQMAGQIAVVLALAVFLLIFSFATIKYFDL